MKKAHIYPSIAAILSLGMSLFFCFYTPLTTFNFWISILYIWLVCCCINLFLLFKADVKTYTQRLLGVIVIKFLAALFFILIFGFLNPHVFYKFSAHFLTHYALFIAFEVAYLLNKIKSEKNKP